jgi:hypothetical protein
MLARPRRLKGLAKKGPSMARKRYSILRKVLKGT